MLTGGVRNGLGQDGSKNRVPSCVFINQSAELIDCNNKHIAAKVSASHDGSLGHTSQKFDHSLTRSPLSKSLDIDNSFSNYQSHIHDLLNQKRCFETGSDKEAHLEVRLPPIDGKGHRNGNGGVSPSGGSETNQAVRFPALQGAGSVGGRGLEGYRTDEEQGEVSLHYTHDGDKPSNTVKGMVRLNRGGSASSLSVTKLPTVTEQQCVCPASWRKVPPCPECGKLEKHATWCKKKKSKFICERCRKPCQPKERELISRESTYDMVEEALWYNRYGLENQNPPLPSDLQELREKTMEEKLDETIGQKHVDFRISHGFEITSEDATSVGDKGTNKSTSDSESSTYRDPHRGRDAKSTAPNPNAGKYTYERALSLARSLEASSVQETEFRPRISRPFVFSYFCPPKTCKCEEPSLRNQSLPEDEMTSIFGTVEYEDFYPGGIRNPIKGSRKNAGFGNVWGLHKTSNHEGTDSYPTKTSLTHHTTNLTGTSDWTSVSPGSSSTGIDVGKSDSFTSDESHD